MHSYAFVLPWIVVVSLLMPPMEISQQQNQPPQPRHLEGAAFDPLKNRLVIHGGVELKNAGFIEPTDTYEFSGSEWRRFSSNGQARRGHAMFFDKKGKMVTCLGGVVQRGDKDSVLFDLQTWDGNQWTMIDSDCPVKEPRATYDEANDRILVYGDAENLKQPWSGEEIRRWELWELRTGQWRKLSDDGPAEAYQPVFNKKTNTVCMIDWIDGQTVVWEWKNNAWIQHKSNSGPPERSKFGTAFHSSDNSIYLFGGRGEDRNFLNDLWRWDGIAWHQIKNINGPSQRASVQLVEGNNELLLYGGSRQSGGLTNELWKWNGQWKKIQ